MLLGPSQPGGEAAGLVEIPEDGLGLAGEGAQLGGQFPLRGRVEDSPRPSQPDRQQALAHQHGQISLGGGHRDLRAGPRVEDVVGLAGQAGTDHVGQRQQRAAMPAGQAGGGQGVGGLARLADGKGERSVPDERTLL